MCCIMRRVRRDPWPTRPDPRWSAGPPSLPPDGLLGEAAAGRPVVALVSGDAGVGKTRLVTELAAPGRRAAASRCCPGAAPSWPTPCPTCRSPTRCATRPPGRRPRPAAGRAGGPAGAVPAAARPAAPAGRPAATCPAWPSSSCSVRCSGMLAELAEASPVLLVLEDLHWADRSTRDLVTFLSRVLHRERVAVVGHLPDR